MKRVIFIFCIVFGISLSACPLAQKPETPTTPETIAEKWLKLVAGKKSENPSDKDESIVFDNKGNLVWTDTGLEDKYSFVQMYNDTHAIYQTESTDGNKVYTGLSVNSDSGRLEIYSYNVDTPNRIKWSSKPFTFSVLHK